MSSGSPQLPQRLADAYFIARHGWTWDDLQGCPSDVVAMMRLIDASEGEAADGLARAMRMQRGG